MQSVVHLYSHMVDNTTELSTTDDLYLADRPTSMWICRQNRGLLVDCSCHYFVTPPTAGPVTDVRRRFIINPTRVSVLMTLIHYKLHSRSPVKYSAQSEPFVAVRTICICVPLLCH